MGKEIVKPTNPNGKISFAEKAAHIGLVPLTIATLTFSAGCAPEASPPQTPVGISGSPQFPGTGNDRPLQSPKPIQSNEAGIPKGPPPTPIPTPMQKKEGFSLMEIFEKKTSSKKPDELFRTLLSTPIEQNSLPPGMRAMTYSAGTLDATSQALKAVGQVTIQISDGDPKFSGQPNGALSFTVFPDAESAKAAYNVLINSAGNKQSVEGFPYPTTSLGTEAFFVKIAITTMPAENVLMAAMLSDTSDYSGGYSAVKPAKYKQNETNALAKSGLEHLRKVGR